MRYRLLFWVTREGWTDQYGSSWRGDINRVHALFEQDMTYNLPYYQADRWMIVEETADLMALPKPVSIK
jgi:ketosteroid isomerase-like protein